MSGHTEVPTRERDVIYCAKTVDDFGNGPEVFWFASLDGRGWLEVNREPKPWMRSEIEELFTVKKTFDPETGMEMEEGLIRISRRWLRRHGADFWTVGGAA